MNTPGGVLRPSAIEPGSRRPGVTVLRADGSVARVRASSTADAAEKARRLTRGGHGVVAAGVTSPVSALTDPAEPQQYYLRSITAPQAWSHGATGSGLVVAVVDTGIDGGHRDLAGRIAGAADCTSGTCVAGAPTGALHWHGTHVAGTVAAARNGVGIAGVAPSARLLDVRVLDRSGAGDTASVAAGIAWAVSHGAKVINLSLGGPGNDGALHAAIARATAHGVLVVAAAGNGYQDGNAPSYPAAYSEVVAVAATTSAGGHASFSNTGSYVDIAAPGVGILSDYPGNRVKSANGTSMASPQVAGAAADVWSAHRTWSAAQVRGRLQAFARDLGAPGRDNIFGSGLVQVASAALNSTRTITPVVNLTVPREAPYRSMAHIRVRISNNGIPLPGVAVMLQWAYLWGPWHKATTGRVGADGTTVLRIRTSHTMRLRAVSTGTRVLASAASPTRTMLVSPAVRIGIQRSGTHLKLTGRTLPEAPSVTVVLQRHDRAHGWRSFGHARTSRRGEFSAWLRIGGRGKHLRVITARGHRWGLSPTHPFILRVHV